MEVPKPRSGATPSIPGVPVPRDERPERPIQLPLWSWSYVTFRFGDGLTSGLIPLAVLLHYGLPVWAMVLTTAAQNLAGVPATFLWGKLMDMGVRRRPIVVTGFAMAAFALGLLATLPPFPVFVVASILYTAFGVATAPAASTMVLQRVPRHRWSRTTAALSRRTGTAYLSGMLFSILIAVPSDWWLPLGSWGPRLAASIYLGGPHFPGAFAAAAVMAGMAAVLAVNTVPPYQPPLPHEAGADPLLIQAGQRRFERAVFFPGRLRNRPRWRDLKAMVQSPHRLWPLGYAFTFMGSVCFFSSYPGILHELGLAAGLVLLAQAPSNMVTPVAYPWAGRRGHRIGESRGVVEGSILRSLALPLFCLTVVVLGAKGFLVFLVLHAVMGLSFALIQVNGPVILAGLHPGGRGQGVGTYHAAVGAGTLLGSLSAFLLLRVADYRWSYLAAVAFAVLGGLLLQAAHRRTTTPQAPSGGPSVDDR
ncbi:MAG TPA: MFS transporter [Candidatus Thermoplasmatota archaeon]|nr:MFS transporter [Candidatus Thermoplasmatota archaeon]